ncbi:hypothetical protein [Pedobacter sp. Leaf216]|uniref:hypothetical protein n=1 Tax=Pedobacter sp. Leaf216 TaxID=1735684 RepID=UPI000AC0FE68|nr:hypothetical protein [Pedobacter sp. Leaf216]
MDIQKNLLLFYKKSLKLKKARLKVKTLKESKVKISDQKNLNISEIQDAANHYLKIKKFSDRIGQLPSDLLGIQRKLISTFKTIGLRVGKKILIEDKKYGNIYFWYEGTFVYFEDKNSQSDEPTSI